MAKQIFLIKIEITNHSWHYKPGDILHIPVLSNNSHNALLKFENQHNGGEYPRYSVLNVLKTDGLFCPVGFEDVLPRKIAMPG